MEKYASGYAMGEIFMQGGNPMCCYSEMFHGGVLNYPTYDKELYGNSMPLFKPLRSERTI